ncbi:MAG: FAD-binding protein [Solirubrobacteraceae bacterium]|nr:FAD-binding protein [Solirubrobacteraceae bacterium]
MRFAVRRTWRNQLGNQRIDPLRIYEPRTVADVQAIVRLARERGVPVRAVGSGHSWSDVALTEGFLLEPTGMARVPAPEPDFLAPEWTRRRLVRAEAGARIKELNAYLDANGMGLSNMGGYDHQTIAGVTATSTHGSGIAFGPLNDALRSLDVVVGDGSVQRIEPAGGPTDRAAYEAHHGGERTLVQDDDVFDAVCVGIGCMGVICSALVEVRERFFLREVRELHPWAKVRADLLDGAVLDAHEHYELAFSPYDDGYAHPFLVTTRDTIDDPRHRLWHARTRNLLVEAAALFPLTPHVINLLLDLRPSLAPKLLLASLRALVKKRYDNVSFKVFNIGAANILPAYSCEIGVPIDGRHIEAVETIFRVARERRELGRVYQSSPIALRFVKASPAHLSMMNGRDTMMIELIGLNGNDGGIELLKAYEEALYALGGRPHWGHLNTLSGSHGFVASMYPRHADWLAVRARLDPDGVFDSPFTKRAGLSSDRFVP